MSGGVEKAACVCVCVSVLVGVWCICRSFERVVRASTLPVLPCPVLLLRLCDTVVVRCLVFKVQRVSDGSQRDAMYVAAERIVLGVGSGLHCISQYSQMAVRVATFVFHSQYHRTAWCCYACHTNIPLQRRASVRFIPVCSLLVVVPL